MLALRLIGVASCLLLCPCWSPAQDWAQWRGPTSDNHAPPSATAPLEWDEQTGIAWKTALPGRGNSSPTLVGDRIYLTTGDEEVGTQSLLILDRATGELLDEVIAHEGGLPEGVYGKNSHANATVASDGERLYAMFLNDEAPTLTAFDLQGERLWRKRVCGPARLHFEYGFGSSPIVVDGRVVVAVEHHDAVSGVYAFDGATGELAWRTPRPNQFSYSTPAPAPAGEKRVLLMCGNDRIAAYDPQSGEGLWERESPTMATCGTMVWDAGLGLGFASGGHPKQFTLAVRLGGDHEIAWQNSVKCYEQSLLVVEGHVYAVSDRGVAYCWRGSDGEELWKRRLGGNFSSSPLLVGGVIYTTNEGGEMFAFEANPQRYVNLAKTRLGDTAYATPTPADGRLYHRYGKEGQEYLVAIGE